ncbi:MAG: alkaline phosphatase family protein [Planctomycetota bacterium]
MSKAREKPDWERCITLGMDGLDARILAELVENRRLPNFAKLVQHGALLSLQTSNPAISPVAWSNIATGAGPEHHGIFDFIHRDPSNYLPYLSLRRSSTGILGTRYRRARRCDGFWRYASDAGIPTTVIRWPVTFPAERVTGRFLSGLGVPDILGSEGQYVYYTTEAVARDDPSSHNVVRVRWDDGGAVLTSLKGPLISRRGHAELPLVIKRRGSDSVRVDLRGAPAVEAKRDSWTPWVKIAFKMGLRRIGGMVRFLLVEAEPDLKLFVYPTNIDPTDQAFPITYPAGFGHQLEDAIGAFHTLGMPEMIHPLSHKRYGLDEFLKQVQTVANERKLMFLDALSHFDEGLLAFVFDHTDRMQHAFWSMGDTQHPIYDQKEANVYGNVIHDMYQQMDGILGKALERADDKTILLVVSDHGFKSFRRQAHINRWLIKNGYMHLKDSDDSEGAGLFKNVAWERTKAYALGFASIYVNLAGREGGGIVKRGTEYDGLCRDLASALEHFTDPDNNSPVVHKVYLGRQIYHSGPLADNGPDLVVGLKPGCRFSWQTALGGAPPTLVEDNTTRWSGDHIFDPNYMSGVLLSNRKINGKNPRSVDIAPTVLSCFGLARPSHMAGSSLI